VSIIVSMSLDFAEAIGRAWRGTRCPLNVVLPQCPAIVRVPQASRSVQCLRASLRRRKGGLRLVHLALPWGWGGRWTRPPIDGSRASTQAMGQSMLI